MSELRQKFEEEIKQVQNQAILSPEYMRKKLVFYIIRTLISIVLFYSFWDHELVKWILYAYIPINLISLGSIVLWPYILKRKTAKTLQKIDELEGVLLEEEE